VTAVDRHVVLLGLMGAGKTSIGTEVAARLGRPLIDGDERLAERTGGRTAADIEDDRGLEVLHQMEAEIALEALALADPAVIGPASSVCESASVRDALADHLIVWLHASADYLARNAVTKSHRPLLDSEDPIALFERQLAIREPLVLPLAALVVDVTAVSKDDAAAQIVGLVADRSS
jgi:shikimate kinase